MAKDKVPMVSMAGLRSDGTAYIPLTEKEFLNRRRSISKAIDILPEFKKEIVECLEKIPLTEKEILDRRYSYCKGFDKILPELKKEIAESPIGEIRYSAREIEKKMAPEFELKRDPGAMNVDLPFHLWDEDLVVKKRDGLVLRNKLPEDKPADWMVKMKKTFASCKDVRESK